MLRGHSGDSITERAVEAYSQIEDPRLREVMAALIRHLHALVKELTITHNYSRSLLPARKPAASKVRS